MQNVIYFPQRLLLLYAIGAVIQFLVVVVTTVAVEFDTDWMEREPDVS